MVEKDTICALSTAPGQGGIAVIRVSGNEAFAICDKIFKAVQKDKKISTQPGYSILFGSISDGGNLIDEVLVSVFRTPHSYTGEDTVEITCHGSFYIQQHILRLLIEKGCRSAMPGEFTQRAFLNGKMDLSQAEAVADLIASTTASTHSMAINQMRGGFSSELNTLRSKLLDFVSLVELELDFSEEDVEFANREQLRNLSGEIGSRINKLAQSFNVGNVLKNGIPVAIVGETNAGKSTLLNILLNEEKAIVSDIHGTTRDVIEDTVNIKGITFRFIDTAGIRETNDTIENMGIERTYQKIEQASIILWIIDCTQVCEHIEWMASKIVPRTEDKQLILVFNKIDNVNEEECNILENMFSHVQGERIYISAKRRKNIEDLEKILLKASQIPELNNNDVIVSNIRHYEALLKAGESIARVNEGIDNNISGDFLSQDIRDCMHFLGLISGIISSQEVLQNVFSRFCIGK